MKLLRYAVAPLATIALLGLQAGVAPPASAVGSIRYASTTGTVGQTCATPATACNIEKAVNSAGADDEIVIAPGTYTPAAPLANPAIHLNVHGTAGQPRPVLTINAPLTYGLFLNGTGAQVSDLVINQTSTGFALDTFSTNVLVQRVEVHASGDNSIACLPGVSGLFRDSLCVATGANSAAVAVDYTGAGGTLRIRNLTGIATGTGSVGLRAHAGPATPLVADVRNSIFQGVAADIESTTTGAGATSAVAVQSSNYDVVSVAGVGATATAAGTGTNQTAAPLFADTTAYHQAAGSPTVDKGTVDADLGSADLDADPRVLYAAPDIGVDEYRDVTPADTTPPDTVFDKTPKKKTFSHRAKFLFHSTEPGSKLTCRLDKKPAVSCVAFSKRMKKAGKHTFTVVATDAHGNVDPTPATYTWKVKKKRHRN